MIFILTFVTWFLCDLKDVRKKLFTVVFSGLLLRQHVIVYASAFYGKVEITFLTHVTVFHLFTQAIQNFYFVKV